MSSRPTKNMISIIYCITFMLSAILLKTAYADEVILKDGSRLFGTVVSMESRKLVFNTSFAGDISIKWDQVARLTTDTPMEVSLGDKKIYKGTLIPSAKSNGWVTC